MYQLPCPSTTELEWLARNIDAADQVAGQLLTETLAHVVACPACAQRFDSIVSPATLLSTLRELQASGSTTPTESNAKELKPLMDRLGELYVPCDAEQSHGNADSGLRDGGENSDLPSNIGNYVVLNRIGSGGMGQVLRGWDPRLQRTVALKMIRLDRATHDRYRRRFALEGKTIAQLNHPNIVHIFEVGEYQSTPYLALEYITGGSLAAYLAGRPVPMEDAARLSMTLANALSYAHRQGTVHRDLKPANILLQLSSASDNATLANKDSSLHTSEARRPNPLSDYTPKLADFGLARQIDEQDLTMTGELLGTPSYLAPEMTRGESTQSSTIDQLAFADIYSLGAVLYELLTGRPPFLGVTLADTFEQVRTLEPLSPRRLNPAVPHEVATICLKCLEKNPTNRYPSAKALADDLQRYLDGRPILARPVGIAARVVKWSRRNPVVAGLSGVAALSLGILVVGAVAYEKQLSSALANAEDNRKAAVSTALQAKESEEKAMQAYHASRETIDKMLEVIEAQSLASIPGVHEVQREQREIALQFFEQVGARRGASRAVRVDAARARYMAGQLQMHLGRLDDAKASYEAARNSLLALYQDRGDDLQLADYLLAAQLSDALEALASVHSALDEPDLSLALAMEALAVAEKYEGLTPIPYEISWSLLNAHFRLGTILTTYRGKFAGSSADDDLLVAIDHTESAYERLKTIADQHPDDREWLDKLARAELNLSVMYQQLPDAMAECKRYHDLAEATFLKSLELFPQDIALACDLALLRVNWAFIQEANGQLEQAIDDLQHSIDILEPLVSLEPKYAPGRDALYRAHGVRAQILDSFERYSESSKNWERCVVFSEDENTHRLSYAFALCKAERVQEAVALVPQVLADRNLANNPNHLWLACKVYTEASAALIRQPDADKQPGNSVDYLQAAMEVWSRVKQTASHELFDKIERELNESEDLKPLRDAILSN